MYETVVDAIVRATGAPEESRFVVYLRGSLQREYLDEQAFIESPLEEFAATAFRVAWTECALDRRRLARLADAICSVLTRLVEQCGLPPRVSERVALNGHQHWRYVERVIVLGRRAPASRQPGASPIAHDGTSAAPGTPDAPQYGLPRLSLTIS